MFRQQGYGPPGPHLGMHLPNPTDSSVFIKLETCNYEQNAETLRIYIPLRGVQTDMIKSTFSSRSAEVSSCSCWSRSWRHAL